MSSKVRRPLARQLLYTRRTEQVIGRFDHLVNEHHSYEERAVAGRVSDVRWLIV